MKKILLILMCFMIIGGCEKKMDVIQKEDGYKIEKIASIPLNVENGYRDVSLNNQKLEIIDFNYVELDENRHGYEIDVMTNEIKEFELPKIVMKSNDGDGNFDYKFDCVLKETQNYKITAKYITVYREGKPEKQIDKYFYNTKEETILLYEKETTKFYESERIKSYNGFYDDEQLGDLLLYSENDEILVNKIDDGKLEVINKFPLDDEKYHMAWIEVTNGEYNVTYEGEEKNKFVVGDEIYELDKNEGIISILKDYILVSNGSRNNEMVDASNIQIRLIDRNTQKNYKISRAIGACFDDYKYNRILTYNEDGKYCFMDLNTEQIIQRNLPFESNFSYIQINDKQYIFYDLNQPDFYKVTLE